MAEPDLRRRVEELEALVDQLTIQSRALQELCLKKKLFTREELKTLSHEIDAVDGAMDGRVTRFKPPRRGD